MTVILVYAVMGYLAIGAVVSLPVVLWGLARVDPVASGASLWVRLTLWPGSAVLWPMMLARAIRVGPQSTEPREGNDES